MTRKPVDQLGDLQREVLECLWKIDAGTVQEVLDRLNKGRRKLAYTTVLTTLQNLQKAGWVKPQKSGRAYVYRPTRSKDEASAGTVRAFVKRAFGGNPQLMFQSLLNDEKLSQKDIEQLRSMLAEKTREDGK